MTNSATATPARSTKAKGRTLDQTYLYHSEHWRSASSYVAMTRHREKAALFVARNTAQDVKQLARQMGRTDDRRAASMFQTKRVIDFAPELTPAELNAQLSPRDAERLRSVADAPTLGISDRAADPFAAMQRIHERLSGPDMLERARSMQQRYADLSREDDPAREAARDRGDEAGRTRRR